MAKKDKIAFNSTPDLKEKERITSFDKKDSEQAILQRMQNGRTPKPKEKLKSVKKLFSFTENEVKELEKIQKILGDSTFNKTIYKLIELGKQHIKESM